MEGYGLSLEGERDYIQWYILVLYNSSMYSYTWRDMVSVLRERGTIFSGIYWCCIIPLCIHTLGGIWSQVLRERRTMFCGVYLCCTTLIYIYSFDELCFLSLGREELDSMVLNNSSIYL